MSGGGGIDYAAIMNFLNSPTGQAAIGAAGGAFSAAGQRADNEASRAQNNDQFWAGMIQNQFNADRTNQLAQAQTTLQQDPLGASQKFAQKQALLSAILPNLRNSAITPGNPNIAARMGQGQGPLPEGGLDPKMIEALYGNNTTLESLAHRQRQLTQANPDGPQQDFSTMFGSMAQPQMDRNNQYAGYQQAQRNTARLGLDQQLNQSAVNGDINQHKANHDDDWLEENVPPPEHYHYHDGELSEDGSGFWHKFARYAGIAGAGVATAMTGGAASPLLIAAIGAGSGAAAGWGTGGGTKAALLGAAGGAVPGVGSYINNPGVRAAIQAGAGAGIGGAQGGVQGAITGGAMGALGSRGGAQGSNLNAAGGIRQAALQMAKNPNTYANGAAVQFPQAALAAPVMDAIWRRR